MNGDKLMSLGGLLKRVMLLLKNVPGLGHITNEVGVLFLS